MIENSLQAVLQFWENLTRYDLTEYFGKKIAQRGQDYANNGNVESVWITEDKNTILAVVNGEHTYKTIVRIKLTGNSAKIASQCTCPYGSQCKHGAAAIVAYLNLYAKKETVCTCKQISETHWELEMPDGKTIQREFDITKNGQSENESSESDNETLYQFLKQQLKQKSRKELAQYVLQLAKKYSSFREVIRKEYVAHSIAEISDADFLLQRAVGTIKKQTNNNQYDDGDDSPPIDFSELLVIVKQFTKVNNPIPALTKISRKLLEVAERCYDDSSGIEEVLETITKVVLASQCRELEIILFACELRMMNDYGFADGAVGSILEHPWPIDTLSTVADKLIEQHGTKPDYFPLQLILKLLDRVNRQDDATDYLRSVAEQQGEYHSFLHRLIEFNHLGEAEQLCLKQIKKDMQHGRFNVNRNNYVSCLQEIAEKRNDWNTIASIQVSEFSDYQSLPKIIELLATAQRLKCVNAVRSKIERVLLAKELPEAIAEMFNSQRTGKEQSADRTKLELVLQKPAKEQKKRFDLLCDWAIAERRVDDAIKWFDEFSKAKSTGQYIDLKKLADAVLDKYPARAAVFYRQVAEQRIENAKDYYGAVDCLKRMKTALEKDHRLADWDDVIAEIRTVHNRKRNLLQLLDELQGKSIVREKQQKV